MLSLEAKSEYSHVDSTIESHVDSTIENFSRKGTKVLSDTTVFV